MVKNVVEGYSTAKAVHQLAKIHNVDMPLVEATYRVLYNDENPKNIVKEMMTRKIKS